MNVKKNALMEIYTSKENTFSVGFYLLSINEYSLFECIDEQGKEYCLFLIRGDYISNIEYETEYLKKMYLYREYWKKNFGDTTFYPKFNINKDSDLDSILLALKGNNNLIALRHIENEQYLTSGYIKSIGSDSIEIACVDVETAGNMGCVSLDKKGILLMELKSIDTILLEYANKNCEI